MLLDKLNQFKTLPKGAKVLTSDTTSMYINVHQYQPQGRTTNPQKINKHLQKRNQGYNKHGPIL